MNDDFHERLDAALDMWQAVSPDGDAELLELLQVAAAVRADAVRAQPSAAGLRRGRSRLLQALSTERRVSRSGPWAWLNSLNLLLGPVLRPRRWAYALALVAVVAVSGGVLAVSAESLPGDPLYPLKRMEEQVSWTLTLDERARASLGDQFARERTREWQEIQQQRRVTRAQLDGTVQSVGESSLVVSGVAMRLDRSTLGDLRWLQVGVRVYVLIQSNADGSLEAIALTLVATPEEASPSATPMATAPASRSETPARTTPSSAPEATRVPASPTPSQPEGTPTPAPTTRSISEQTRTPEPTRRPEATRDDNATAAPAPTRRSDATSTPVATQTPRSGRTPDARATATPNSTPDAARTEEPERTPSASPSPVATATRQASPTETPRPTETAQSSPSPRPSETKDGSQSVSSPTPRSTQTPQSGDAIQTPQPTRTPTVATPTQSPQPTGTEAASR